MRNWLEHILRHTRKTPLHPLQKVGIVGLIVLVTISLAQITLPPSLEFKVDQMLSAVLPSIIVDLTNSERLAENLSTLKRSALLDEAARLKAEHMKENGYFAHYSPDGVTPWHWFDVAKYNYVYAGENLAVYFEDSEDVVKAWMESPLHKDNILKKEYTEIGVAAVEGKYDGYSTVFVVQLFGTPATQIQVAPVVEKSETATTLADASIPDTLPIRTIQGDVTVSEETEEAIPLKEDTETSPALEEVSDGSSVVEKVVIDEDTIYVSDHISTTTIVGQTNVIPERTSTAGSVSMEVSTKTALRLLYVFMSVIVLGFVISSALLAEKHRQHLQALYGVGLLVIITALFFIQTHAVMATTSLFN